MKTVAARRVAFFCLVLLVMPACSFMGEEEASFFLGRDVITRGQAKAMLRAGIGVNIQLCPENTYAGYYAIESVVPQQLNHLFYDPASIEFCFLALTQAPCGLNPESDQETFLTMYRAIIQTCNPRSRGID